MKNTRHSKKYKKQATEKIHLLRVGGVIALVVLLAITSVMVVTVATVKINSQARLSRIKAIYSSLNLDSSYQGPSVVRVFGEKRVYEYDKGRSYSSELDFERGATVSDTITDLTAKAKVAGFTKFDEPYPGSIGSVQYHYKSQKGEYLRITVSSKQRDDQIRNNNLMNRDILSNMDTIDPNAGPVNVVIKVNLDDNNE